LLPKVVDLTILAVEQATNAVRDLIVTGGLQPDEGVSEGRLAERLGISTTPVREALTSLQREGLLTIVPQKGTFMFELDHGKLNHLCELRVGLEPAALQLAVERNGRRLNEALTRVVGQMRTALTAGDIPGYLRLDTAFHQTFFDLSGNPYLQRAHSLIAAKTAALRNRLGTDPHHIAKSMREHEQMAEAVARGDLPATLGILHRHVARKEGSYWEHLDKDLSSLLRQPFREEEEPRRQLAS
jgi:DNA-binding GntR family transcriptional regulator